ncbi:MAG TPA: sensor histidine kinase [Xanthomonadales bacterium]|nr:sensor histidine kinase [Xanthomonadales bacterium]
MSTERTPTWSPTPAPADDAPLREQLTQLKQQQERLFASLATGQQQFKHLARQVWRVQEEERRRLARELHDGIGGNLTALKHQIEALEIALHARPDLRERAGAALALTAATLEDTRELSRMLRPQVLDDLGLDAALNWLARHVASSAGFRVEVDASNLAVSVDPDVATLVFRIAQEALANAAKHSAASHVLVHVAARDDQLALLVSDDGTGCDPARALARNAEGLSGGLSGMRERVGLFGGRFHFVSAPGEGAQLRVVLPLQAPPEPVQVKLNR